MLKDHGIGYYLIVSFLVAFIVWITDNIASDKAYNKGVQETTKHMRESAIKATVGEYVITNILTGSSEFRWKTNNPKYLFK